MTLAVLRLLAPWSRENVNELLHTYLKHEACILPAKTGTLFRKTSGGQGEQDREEQRYAINSWWVVKQQPPQKKKKNQTNVDNF